MPTPIFAMRLSAKTQQDLAEMAKIYGSPNTRAFAREILEVMTSGDLERVKLFNGKLIKGMGEQLTLKLNAAMDGAMGAEKSAKEPKKPKGAGKGAGSRAKRV